MTERLRGYESDDRCGCCGKFSIGILVLDTAHDRMYKHTCETCREVWNVTYCRRK